MTVVVLPTPPFWFVQAVTRTTSAPLRIQNGRVNSTSFRLTGALPRAFRGRFHGGLSTPMFHVGTCRMVRSSDRSRTVYFTARWSRRSASRGRLIIVPQSPPRNHRWHRPRVARTGDRHRRRQAEHRRSSPSSSSLSRGVLPGITWAFVTGLTVNLLVGAPRIGAVGAARVAALVAGGAAPRGPPSGSTPSRRRSSDRSSRTWSGSASHSSFPMRRSGDPHGPHPVRGRPEHGDRGHRADTGPRDRRAHGRRRGGCLVTDG